MYEESREILIVGAGPTGLVLAVELARRRVPFRLIDAAETPFEGSRGKGLQPRTLEIFDQLGVIDDVLKAGALYPRMRVHVGPMSFRAGSLGTRHAATPSTPYPNLWLVPQARTEEILRTRLEQLGGRVEFGCALSSLTQDAASISASLSTGEVVKASFAVGCDGGKSSVRAALGLELHGETLPGKPLLVGDVAVDGLDRREWHVWPFAKGGMVGLCPLPNSDLFQLTAPAAVEQEGLEVALRRVTGKALTHVAWKSVYRPHVRMVERYRVGRVLLAGDAAHVHPPAGGQGLNTGIQDAWNLGWKLAWVSRGGPDSVLDSYEEERLPVAAAVLHLSQALHQKTSLKRGALTNQLALHYRGSSLGSGEARGPLQPGDRMADQKLPDGRRLFEVLRGTEAVQLLQPDGLRILIRPDGYVASTQRARVDHYGGEPVQFVEVS